MLVCNCRWLLWKLVYMSVLVVALEGGLYVCLELSVIVVVEGGFLQNIYVLA